MSCIRMSHHFLGVVVMLLSSGLYAQGTYKIYIDADRSISKESGIAIEQGIKTALYEVDNILAQKKVEVVVLDHRGSSVRSREHLEQYLKDDEALVVFSGLHSPPLLANRDFINENQILVLDPWAAATPITRYPSQENWIFRLSIDDSKAGHFIVDAAYKEGFKKAFLLLEDTGWGRSNLETMTKALAEKGLEPIEVQWFNWNLHDNTAKSLLHKAYLSKADVILMVANAPEGKKFAKAITSLPVDNRLPIRSHWGITGGNFSKEIDLSIRQKIDLKFIQTKFSFFDERKSPLEDQVLQVVTKIFPDVFDAYDVDAPVGFAQAYDLTKLLIAAVENITLNDDIQVARNQLRLLLENINEDVNGLIKTYSVPFGKYTDNHPDAHEALTIEDYSMARYGRRGEVILD